MPTKFLYGVSVIMIMHLLSGCEQAVQSEAATKNTRSGSQSSLVAPINAAQAVTFIDVDTDGGEVEGSVTIVKATDESDVTHYTLYWGSDESTKLSDTAIAEITASDANLTHSFSANTEVPSGATHLLVFTKNDVGEMTTGVSVTIEDDGLPTPAAQSVAFTDTDTDAGELAGTLTITKATDETDLTHYVLYWGSSSTAKNSTTPITTIAISGSDVTYTFSASTSIPSGATHLLVFTKNNGGEMTTGVSVLIVDSGVPINAAQSVAFTDTDTDADEIGGTVTITKAADESDVTHYVLYWGSSSTVKNSGTPITTAAVTGSNVTYAISASTAIPAGATHLLVFTKNSGGEMATGVNVAIVDSGLPVNAAQSVAFTDTDTDADELGGTVTITKATDESDVTHYVLYWGSNTTTKNSGTPITTAAVTGSDVTYAITANTAIPGGATHLLVYSKNAVGEMATGVNVAIVDKAVPENAAQSVAFTDTDTDANEIGGTVTITKATDESDVTHYVLYWGSNATTKNSGTPIANLAVTGSNVTHSFAADTPIPGGATHLLVFTKNADGEMATGVNASITDNTGPVGTITVTAPNGGESIDRCVTFNITWTSANFTGNVKIEYNYQYPDPSEWHEEATVSNTGTYSTSFMAPYSTYRIRISSVENPAIFDISDADFEIGGPPC